jgi:3-phosphoshikimate 1-carboxyvinyltransferase
MSRYFSIQLPASKSMSNRWLVLKHLFAREMTIGNLSDAGDTRILKNLLQGGHLPEKIDVQDAGTVARFATALACLDARRHEIYGTERMHERPMGELIDALRLLGAHIHEKGNQGCLPIEVEPSKLKSLNLSISTEKSSQFLSALMMIAPAISGGLAFKISGRRNSWPYVEMTAAVMRQIGLQVDLKGHEMNIPEQVPRQVPSQVQVEADWSSAAFFWQALIAMPVGTSIFFPDLIPFEQSLQGDAVLMSWQGLGGVQWEALSNGMLATKRAEMIEQPSLDFSNCPDLAIPVVLGLSTLDRPFVVQGLHTLDFKESKRLTVLKDWLIKMGAQLIEEQARFTVKGGELNPSILKGATTFEDHRLVMALAVLLKAQSNEFVEKDTVQKSFPTFWEQFQQLY